MTDDEKTYRDLNRVARRCAHRLHSMSNKIIDYVHPALGWRARCSTPGTTCGCGAWLGMRRRGRIADGVDAGCPACASTDLQRRGVQRTRQSVYQRYQCQGCGKWLRSTRRTLGHDVTEVAA